MIDRAPEVDPVVVQAEFREPRHPGGLWGLPRLQNLARRAAELHPEAPGLEVLNVIVEIVNLYLVKLVLDNIFYLPQMIPIV